MSNPKNNDAIVTVITKRLNAVQKYLKTEKAEIPVQGDLLKPAALLKLYQGSLDARAAVTAGHATYQGALKARAEAEANRLAADESLKAWVLARYGAGSTEASEFGFAPRKQPVVSAATRAAAVLQNQATRKARGTMPREEKLKIKGVVPTSTAPAAPATPSTSAPAQPLVAPPVPLTAAPPAAMSPAPSAQIAAGPAAAPPPTVTPAAVAATPMPPVAVSAPQVTSAPAVVAAPVVAAPAPEVTHS
jgi:hypothetical protein